MTRKDLLTSARNPDGDRELRLREALADDLPALVDLDRQCFGRRAWSPREWREVVLDPAFAVIVLARGDALLAAAVLLGWPPQASLASIAVAPGHRNRGLGTRMLHEAIARARRAGAHFLSLEVDLLNRDARRLYRREGFGVVRRFREDGRQRVEMALRLGGARRAAPSRRSRSRELT